MSLGSCGHVAYGSVRSVQLFRFDSKGRLSAELGNYQVRKSVDWLDHKVLLVPLVEFKICPKRSIQDLLYLYCGSVSTSC